jgi:hypothetical protein
MTAHDPLPGERRCMRRIGGWIFRVRVESLPGDLLSPAAYVALTEGGDGHGD